jgi:hypothetical protein
VIADNGAVLTGEPDDDSMSYVAAATGYVDVVGS